MKRTQDGVAKAAGRTTRRAARRAVRRATAALAAMRASRNPAVLPLDSVRRRLEILVAAMYGRAIGIEPAPVVARAGLLQRVLDAAPRHLRVTTALASTDGEHVRLPGALPASEGVRAATARYRLLAIEQAERVVRGTAAQLPDESAALERDLYLLAEGSAIDCHIASTVPGIRSVLVHERATALSRRPALESLRTSERVVERLVRAALRSDPTTQSDDVTTPDDSLAWARATAAEMQPRFTTAGERYRGVSAVSHWGVITARASDASATEPPATPLAETAATVDRTPKKNRPRPIPSGAQADRLMMEMEDAQGPPSGNATVTEGERATEGVASESGTHDLDAPDTDSMDDGHGPGIERPEDGAPAADAPYARTDYPEWDFNIGAYRPRGATVVTYPAAESDDAWAAGALAAHGPLVRQVRQQFERLRARRERLPRQQDGDELDLAACIAALVDRRMGRSPDDRLYVAVHPARQPIGIALLVDMSRSTNAAVAARRADPQQVIEVEKTALLLASEALDALGDRYAMLAFSSYGAADVRVASIKQFGERNGDAVRRRVAAIAPDGNTRLGAAIRHATSLLAEQPVSHRLLLILSDGKPSDTDRYFEPYGIADSRQAILEARATGVYPFCLAVHAEDAPAYLTHIFGPAGHTILTRPDHLPDALLRVIRHLLGAR